MKRGGLIVIWLAGGLVLTSSARAVTADSSANPYASIVVRNVFDLKPKPPPPSSDTSPVLPPQKIIPTGIFEAFGKKQALFKTTMPAMPGQPVKEASFALSEGERAGEITVLEIDAQAQTIKFDNHGSIDLKDLQKDGLKPSGSASAVPPPGAAPGAPGMPVLPANAGIPGVVGGGVTTVGGGGAASVARPLRVPLTTASSYAAGVRAQNAAAAAPPVPTMSPEEQAVMIEVNRKLTADAVQRGDMPPLPPGFLPGQ